MPFYIIREDITKLACDAIVNAANRSLCGGGGVDGCIHRAAGEELLRECLTLGGCETGEAKVTGGYALPAKNVIHTVGPIWRGGGLGEEAELRSCYKNSLALAKMRGFESVAFPLISAGAYGYPRREALRIAVEEIREFLSDNDITVYLTIVEPIRFEMHGAFLRGLREYISNTYDDGAVCYRRILPSESSYVKPKRVKRSPPSSFAMLGELGMARNSSFSEADASPVSEDRDSEIRKLLMNLDDTFAVTLLKLIDLKGMSETECYKKANVAKQTWYKIMNEKDYRPSKTTVLSFAIALSLTLEETYTLLETVGFTFSHSSHFDVIIEYFIKIGEYDIHLINQTLFNFDLPCLGV